MNSEQTIYQQLGESAGLLRIIQTFYGKVVQEPLLAPLFPEDLNPVIERQHQFLTQFFGGPPLYSEQHGHPMMRARHMRFPVTNERADAWLGCMNAALRDQAVEDELREFVIDRLKGPAYHFVNTSSSEGRA
ncbi:globin domain-containing protein [Saccharibacillus kuerlensis]|uniref:Group 2 truncated hemoglobin YjbI n=1 Tax=Saccharibacillus kuerlensis TaxID=459527 RepID=A0ABQ2LBS2_9BACL|nr:globin [Saccharibacillus kuerlensis]GGO09607.1 group 2 truncated hemoglobin YjbI [Saccharibacillus kuerlensis]